MDPWKDSTYPGRLFCPEKPDNGTVVESGAMDTVPSPQDLNALKKWLHDLNNRMGVILANAELLQLEALPPQAATRRQTIEDKAVEVRGIVRAISDHYFS